MNEYNNLLNNLEILKLEKMRSYLPNYLEEITNKKIPFQKALLELTNKEIEYRDERASKIQITVSAFPYEKEIKDFDFDYQPSIDKEKIEDLNTLRFIEKHENILFVGSSGVGKTHLATSIGITAARKRYSVYFISCHDLITQLNKAHFENKLESEREIYAFKFKSELYNESIPFEIIIKNKLNIDDIVIITNSNSEIRNQYIKK